MSELVIYHRRARIADKASKLLALSSYGEKSSAHLIASSPRKLFEKVLLNVGARKQTAASSLFTSALVFHSNSFTIVTIIESAIIISS